MQPTQQQGQGYQNEALESLNSSLEAPATGITPNPDYGVSGAAAPQPPGDNNGLVDRVMQRSQLFNYNRSAFAITAFVIILLVLVAVGSLLFFGTQPSSKNQAVSRVSQYPSQNLSVSTGQTYNQLLGTTGELQVNGQLSVKQSLTLTPGSAPSTPTAGQVYYDSSTNQPYYYNGSDFVSLGGVNSVGGASGDVSVGSGLQVTNNQITLDAAAQAAVAAGSSGLSGSGSAGQLALFADGHSLTGSSSLPLSIQGNITQTGALNGGSITTGFGTINTSNNIVTTAVIQGGSLNVAAGNFSVNGSGNIATAGTLTVGTLGAAVTPTPVCLNASNQLSSCGSTSGDFIEDQFATTQTANFNIQSADPTQPTALIKAITGQTAALLAVNDLLGNPLLSVGATGTVRIAFSTYIASYNSSLTTQTALGVSSGAAANVAVTIRGNAGQTADLLQLQDSTGAPLARIASDGDLFSAGRIGAGLVGGGIGNTAGGFGVLSATVSSAVDSGLVVKGATGQTGDLLQLQNTGGTVLSTFNAAGQLGIGTGTPAASLDVEGSGTTINGTGTISFPTGTVNVTGTGTSFTTQLHTGDTITAAGQAFVVGVITNDTQLKAANGFNTSPAITNASFTITHPSQRIANGANQEGLVLVANSSQTVGVLDVFSSSGQYEFTVDPNGNVIANGLVQSNSGLVQGTNATSFQSQDKSGVGINSGNLTLRSGNAASGNSGNVSIDVGTASGTMGSISIGGTTATAIGLGNANSLSTIQGTVDFTGSVGVNTTTPIANLDVEGTATVRNGTGTVSTTTATNLITGTGTVFTTQLHVGDTITIAGVSRTVVVIVSDTQLFVENGNWPSNQTNVSFTYIYPTQRIVANANQFGTLVVQSSGAANAWPLILANSAGNQVFGVTSTGATWGNSYFGSFYGSGSALGASSPSVNVGTGSATGATFTSGNLTLDAGAASGGATAGTVGLGNTNAASVTIGHNTATNLLQGSTTATGPSAGGGTTLKVNANAATNVALDVEGNSGTQTSDIFDVVANAGASPGTALQVSSVGAVRLGLNNATVGVGGHSTGIFAASLAVSGGTSSVVQEVVEGVSGQTGNLLQLQDSNQVVESNFNAAGQLTLGTIASSGTVYQGKLILSDGTTDNFGLTLQSAALGGNAVITVPNTGGVADTVCLFTLGNCVTGGGGGGGGGTLTGTGTANFVARWTTGTNLGTGTLVDNGTNVGINNTSPGNPLSINTPTTPSSAAQVLISTGGTNNQGLLIQGVPGQVSNLLAIQNSAGASLFSVDQSGNVNVNGGTVRTFDQSVASTNSVALTLRSGNATGTTSNSGNVIVDSGTATGTTGQVQIGTTNASAITIGASTTSGAVTIQGGNIKETLLNNSGVTIAGTSTVYDAATLGAEMNTASESFGASANGWTNAGTGTSATATHAAGLSNPVSLSPALPITIGNYYQVVYTLSDSAGSVTASLGGVTGTTLPISAASYTQVIKATSTANLSFTPSSTFVGTISAVSVKQLTPATASLNIQSSSGSTALEVRTGGPSTNVNTFVGLQAGQSNTTGVGNTGLGGEALQSNTSGFNNTGIGELALMSNTTGVNNTSVGAGASQFNTGGSNNTSVGQLALFGTTFGSNNTAVGGLSLLSNTTGSFNTALGWHALFANSTGSNNTALGYEAGDSDQLGNFKTLGNLQNATTVGAFAQVQASNSIVLGSVDAGTKVGVGTTVPLNTFSVSPVDLNACASGCPVTATASQASGSGTITASAAVFSAANVGEEFIWANGANETITGFTDTTHVIGSSTAITQTNQAFRAHHAGLQVSSAGNVGINNLSPANPLSVNSLTTPVASAQVAIGTGGASNIGLLVQGVSGQSANYLKIENSSAGTIFSVDSAGNVVSAVGTFRTSGNGGTGNTTSVTLQSGNATVSGNSGNVNVDAGTAAGTTGQVLIGATNASALVIGNAIAGLTIVSNSSESGTFGVTGLTTLSGNAVIGTATQQGKIVLEEGNGHAITLNGTTEGGDVNLNFPTSGVGASDTICLQTANNCNSSLTGGTNNFVARWTGSNTLGTGTLYDDGSHVGINNTSPANLLNVNTLTTADASAQLAVSTGALGNKGIVVQAMAGQTADLLQAQDSTGAVLASIDANGNLSVKSATVNGTLSVNGHIVTGNVTGGTTTVTNGAQAGTGATVSVVGNDTAGTITIVAGTGTSAGDLADLVFATVYAANPHVVISADNAGAASLQPFRSASTTGLSIDVRVAPTTGQTYVFDYFVAQ